MNLFNLFFRDFKDSLTILKIFKDFLDAFVSKTWLRVFYPCLSVPLSMTDNGLPVRGSAAKFKFKVGPSQAISRQGCQMLDFQNQKSQFGFILEGLAMEYRSIF
jgi:hypothetical protein